MIVAQAEKLIERTVHFNMANATEASATILSNIIL